MGNGKKRGAPFGNKNRRLKKGEEKYIAPKFTLALPKEYKDLKIRFSRYCKENGKKMAPTLFKLVDAFLIKEGY